MVRCVCYLIGHIMHHSYRLIFTSLYAIVSALYLWTHIGLSRAGCSSSKSIPSTWKRCPSCPSTRTRADTRIRSSATQKHWPAKTCYITCSYRERGDRAAAESTTSSVRVMITFENRGATTYFQTHAHIHMTTTIRKTLRTTHGWSGILSHYHISII